MNDVLKIEFIDEKSFIAYYITKDIYENEDDYKILFKYLDKELEKKYKYIMHGYYDVYIYINNGIYVIEFDYIDDYGRKDFNVVLFLNSKILYEFYDMDFINDKKIYYDNKFYIEISKVIGNIRLFEYGNIVYGKEVDNIIKNGKTII